MGSHDPVLRNRSRPRDPGRETLRRASRAAAHGSGLRPGAALDLPRRRLEDPRRGARGARRLGGTLRRLRLAAAALRDRPAPADALMGALLAMAAANARSEEHTSE